MFQPFSLFVGLRYTRAKRRNHFISFISLTSMIGIALSVLVLITVLSVMNGFDAVIRDRVMAMARQITVSLPQGGMIRDWRMLSHDLAKTPAVVATAPFIDGQGMLTNGNLIQPALISGVLPQDEKKLTGLTQKMEAGSLDALQPGKHGILIGEQLATNLNVGLGDKINVFVPQASITPIGFFPRFARFTVVGIFKFGNGFGFDNGLGLIHLQDAQALFSLGHNVSGIQLKVTNLYDAPPIAMRLAAQLGPDYLVSDWTDTYGSLFTAIALEKMMMALILLLLVAIAAFNLVSSLVMTVTEKRADIAILRTMGATPRTILTIFMVQGSLIGFLGTFMGFLGGIILSLNITRWVSWIEQTFHVQLLASNVYYVNYLPSRLDWHDVGIICGIALLMSFLATLYPSWQASRIQPAEALRYE